jgi:small GTP-binding protein
MDPYYAESIARGANFPSLSADAAQALHSPDMQYKVVIVGDSGCGKTSLFASYIRGSFPSTYEPTIFENHRMFVQSSSTGKIISADLWDTAGQEEYERLRRLSYQDADIVIVAYALDAPESLLNIHEVWAPEVMTYAPQAKIILVGLKEDIQPHKVSPQNAYSVAKNIGATAHLACSSMLMHNVNPLFDCVFNTAYNNSILMANNAIYNSTISDQSINNKNRKRNSYNAPNSAGKSHRRNISLTNSIKSVKKSASNPNKSSRCTIL